MLEKGRKVLVFFFADADLAELDFIVAGLSPETGLLTSR
jgi:hypothetical protein